MESIPWLILGLPLLTAAVIHLGLKKNQSLSALVSTFSAAVTLALTLVIVSKGSDLTGSFNWASIAGFNIEIGYEFSQMARGMMLVVTGVGFLVHLFSLAYMKEDSALARYFCGLSLFMFSMTGIVLATNFIMMFMFWELVGLSSYLLIGHWYQKDSAADAAKKAFLTNRIGDFGFMIGILMLWGITGSFTFSELATGLAGHPDHSVFFLGIAILCIFAGAMGKSAQAPLHVWLPDAMEGPTPVSALIHAATMVAAGVYMMARLFLALTPEGTDLATLIPAFTGTTIAWIGAITSLLAALMATQQDDIKKILAYSTLSQLGYMVMAVGLLDPEAGMFHLFTHAWFKALLFLGSGAVIFACHHEQDIWKMGGLGKTMPITFGAFAIGTIALCGVPGTAGFFSKEHILESA
ncbi:NADH-quinone oxidoreductase subunit L, partial [Akkermansiaceae bacterium]|nr:NADH-quinone oxidoreductase subunit L [Akkermansiaceae bacterium]